MKKWWVVFIYLIVLIVGFSYRDFILEWIKDKNSSYLYVMLFLSILIATIPIFPFTIFGGIMGVKYGLLLGLFINWFGSITAAIIYYVLGRLLLSKFFERKVEQFPRLAHFQSLIQSNAFTAILVVRLIPVVPPIIINMYSAISNISFIAYILPTAIGFLPPMFMIAFGGEQLFSNFSFFLTGLSIYGLFLIIVFFGYRI